MLRHVSPSYFTSTIYVYELLFNVTQYHIFTLLPEICTEGRGGQIDQPTPHPAPFPIRQKKKKKKAQPYLFEINIFFRGLCLYSSSNYLHVKVLSHSFKSSTAG